MPILCAETEIFPANLFDQVESSREPEKQWWALYTRSRREKELMRRLLAMEIPFYGPVVEKRGRTPQGRIRKAYIPLFANYVFMYGDASQRYAALTTNCVSRDLPVDDGAQLAFDLRQLRQMLVSGISVLPEQTLELGARVRV